MDYTTLWSLQLAKVPELIINAIKALMNKRKTKVYLYGEASMIETDYNEYVKGYYKVI